MDQDPRFIVPYHDPHDTPLSPSIFNMANPTLSDLTNNYYSGSTSLLLPQQQNHNNHGGIIEEGNNPYLFDPMMIHQDQFVQNNFPIGGGVIGNFEPGSSSQVHHVDQVPLTTNDVLGSQNFDNNDDVMILANWPQPPIPFSCSCCLVLREIVHTNGLNCTKLEIHGRPGMITHVIHHPTINMDYSSSSNPKCQMIDFCRRGIDDVKNFLVKYCMKQTNAGYFTLQDPLSAYYEALCSGMEWTEELSDDTTDDDLNANNSDNDNDNEEVNNNEGWRPGTRTTLSVQRNRAGKIKLNDFVEYFHLPIEEASRQINLCSTVIKKVCRKEGLDRWPYRKIRSIARKISALRKNMEKRGGTQSRLRIQAEMNRLEAKLKKHCAGRYPTGLVIP